MDTTDTIQAHQALDHSEKLFRSIFANIPAGVEIYDQEGCLVDVNNKDMEIFGIKDKADIIGINLFSNPNFSAAFIEQIKRKMRWISVWTTPSRLSGAITLQTNGGHQSVYQDK